VAKHLFSDAERFVVYTADGGRCFWCGLPLYYRDVQIDHCIPESLESEPAELAGVRRNYGLGADFRINGFENWVTCHQGCNLRKLRAIVPNCAATLFQFTMLRERAPKLEANRKKFDEDIRRERVLVTLRTALDKGTIVQADVLNLVSGVPNVPRAVPSEVESTIHLSEDWSLIVRGSPADQAKAYGWTVQHVSGNIAYVHNDRVGGVVPNVARPDPSWICSQCGSYGPWDGIICRMCGKREEPD
jgi:hypothetical protein